MELQAPSRWQRVDFISDLHLHAHDMQTYSAWCDYLQNTNAHAIFILGDLFEVWVGDDVLTALAPSSFEYQCVSALRAASARADVFIMQGNRDFLMGKALMQAAGCTLLDDPTVLEFSDQRWLLSHGDALCLDDTDYMQFRRMVRSADWQQIFLGKPLAERLEIARTMREASASRKSAEISYADVDTAAANGLLAQHHAQHMIHGHTHRPAVHDLGAGHQRWVLSDWDLLALVPRAEVLRLTRNEDGAVSGPQRMSPEAACT